MATRVGTAHNGVSQNRLSRRKSRMEQPGPATAQDLSRKRKKPQHGITGFSSGPEGVTSVGLVFAADDRPLAGG